MQQIKGKFEVRGFPLEPDAVARELGLMRMKFEKQFHGTLNATGVVCMMGLINQDTGSGAYVAIEKITGEVDARSGSFHLQHSASMSNGTRKQSISVVPGTGTGALAGIEGTMVIDIVDGQHFYTFDYRLAPGT